MLSYRKTDLYMGDSLSNDTQCLMKVDTSSLTTARLVDHITVKVISSQ